MTAFGSRTLSTDANGNLTGDGTNTYTWDARNHLGQITQGSTTVASFIYDGLGRRMKKTIGSTVTQFVYDGSNPVQELDGASTPSVTANLLTGLEIDEYFTRSDSGGAMNFLTDSLARATTARAIKDSCRRTRSVLLAETPIHTPTSAIVRSTPLTPWFGNCSVRSGVQFSNWAPRDSF